MRSRGQLGQVIVIIFGFVLLVFTFSLLGVLQGFADGAVASMPTLPSEIQGLVRLTPFFILAFFIGGVVVAVGRPSAV